MSNPQNLAVGDIIEPVGPGWDLRIRGRHFRIHSIDGDGARFTVPDDDGFTDSWVADESPDWAVKVIRRAPFATSQPAVSTALDTLATRTSDAVNHPAHYTSDPSGVECITITRHRNFNIGNAFKYLWRNGLKDDPAQDAKAKQIEDLEKAVFYINDEIARIKAL